MFGTAHDVLILTVSLILLGAASAETFYVVQNPTEEGVWPSGFETISEAIQVSASGDEIWIASGTYHETISLDHGVHLYGGFTGNESPEDFDLRDWKANPVIIDGTGFNHSVITLSNAADTLFDGIFIRNGRSLYGGGIHCTTSELTLIDCRVSNNEAFTRVDCEVNSGDWNFSGVNTCYGDCYILGGLGGAVYLEESSLELLSSVIESNTGTMGGGVYGVSNSTVLIQDATLSHNAAIAAREVMDGTCCWVHTTYTECFHAEFDRYAGGYGGGVCVSSASLTILDSDVNRNQARLGGGGVDARGTTEVFYFEDSNFEDNLVESNPSLARRGGGGVSCRSQYPGFFGCTFRGNSSDYDGGGLLLAAPGVYSGFPTVTDCTFENNQAVSQFGHGGGLCVDAYIHASAKRNAFLGNRAYNGGGSFLGSDSTLEDSVWRGNQAKLGGASAGSGDFSRCRMIGNTTDGGRGGALWGKDFLLSNCLLAFNQSLEAGAIYSEPTFDPTRLVNCTLYGNSAEDTGGIVAHRAVYSDLYLSVVNSILWNPGAEIKSDSWSASYSDIQGGATGEGIINAYPLFQDIGEKDFRLLNGSPCIDRGSGEAILASVDLQGARRIQGEGIDIGALESPGDFEAGDPVSITRIYVKTGGADNGPGDSWENAFGSINAAMAWATDGTEIWVQGGDYSEPIVLEEGVSLYGGFSGTETSLSERVPQSNPTRLLGGDFFGSIVLGAGIRSATLDGFTVAGGRSDSGGGINLSGPGSYTVANCRIVDNTSEEEGGGIFCGDGAEVSILHCSIDNNAAEGNGGGVYMGKDSILHFENSQVDSNLAVNGAGIYASLSAGEIADSTFENNHATANSGGAFFSGNLIFSNCLFKGNVATDFGGVQLSGEGAINLNGCRVLSNEARSKGGGIGLTGMASPTFKLTQVSDNQARFGGGLFVADRSLPVFEDCGILRNHAVYRESISPPLGSGGGIYAGGAQLTLRRSLISENTGDYQGGGLFGSHSAYLVQGCTMTRNQGLYGGGVYLWGVPVSPYPTSSFTSCLFAKNRAERFSNIPDGGAACLANDAPAIFENCTLVDNRAKSVGGIGGGILSVTNCILWNEGIEIDSSHVTVSNSSCQGGCYGNGNQYGFPQFKDVLNGDYRLTAGSPCIDRGSAPSNPDPAEVDLDGLSRIQNGIVDIGCYEALEGAQSGPVDEVRSPLYVVHGGTGKNLGGNWEDAFPDIHSALLVSTTGAEIWIAEGEYRESLTVEKGVSLYGGFTGSESSLTERDYGNHFTVIDATGLGRSVMYIPKAVQCVVDGLTLTGGDPGGGIHCDDLSDSVLRNLIVTGNRSEISGAIHMSPNSRAFIENCLLSRNKATRGGAMSIQYAKVEMVHCTLAANSALEGAAVIVTGGGAEPQLRVWNSILWNEGPSEIIAYPSARVIQIENSQIRLARPGSGNSTFNPEFINYADGDFRLSESSPCLDTGKPNLTAQSLNGEPRPVDLPGVGIDGVYGGWDRGAYERPMEGHPTWTPTPTATPTLQFDLVVDDRINALDLLELLKESKGVDGADQRLFDFSAYWMTSSEN